MIARKAGCSVGRFSVRQHARGIEIVSTPAIPHLVLVGPAKCTTYERRWVQGPIKGVAIDLERVTYKELDWNRVGWAQFDSLCLFPPPTIGVNTIDIQGGTSSVTGISFGRSEAFSPADRAAAMTWLRQVQSQQIPCLTCAVEQAVPSDIKDVCRIIAEYAVKDSIGMATQSGMDFAEALQLRGQSTIAYSEYVSLSHDAWLPPPPATAVQAPQGRGKCKQHP